MRKKMVKGCLAVAAVSIVMFGVCALMEKRGVKQYEKTFRCSWSCWTCWCWDDTCRCKHEEKRC